ncbi:MAG TPA: Gfo/Idh/MocA family oxidoreductase, partial [Nitrososphaeraceae archaeon]|nr:Gfo/Idh/MocA family oxidoreductase [Nitrososphaeraceae archaeon]
MEKKVGVIGYGSIGREIMAAIRRQEVPNAKIVGLFDKESQVIGSVDYDNSELHLFSDFKEFYNSPIYSSLDIVIECASKGAVREYGKIIIESKKDLIVLSVGAFSDIKFLSELQNLSNLNN